MNKRESREYRSRKISDYSYFLEPSAPKSGLFGVTEVRLGAAQNYWPRSAQEIALVQGPAINSLLDHLAGSDRGRKYAGKERAYEFLTR
jgi:hypothetical protein